MSKILIYLNIYDYGEYDIFHQTNIEKTISHIKNVRNNDCPNFGNKLWFQGIMSFVLNEDNQVDLFNQNMMIKDINRDYDFIIAPMANIFSRGYEELLNKLAEFFEQIEIPVYVIACGIQAKSYEDMKLLSKDIKQASYRFIKSIYSTRGEFALRGKTTKDFFDLICKNSAIVTGCPSMYQLSAYLKIDKINLKNNKQMKIAVNGSEIIYNKLLKKYNCEFFDQHKYYKLLYDVDINKVNFWFLKEIVYKYGYSMINSIIHNKVKLFFDTNAWWNYLKQQEFDISIGTRIHGTIMAILAGIPAILIVVDERTREMAEFFSIPYIEYEDFDSVDISDIINKVNYDIFNDSFHRHYQNFNNFLYSNGIINSCSSDEKKKFLYNVCTDNHIFDVTENNIKKYSDYFSKYKKVLKIYDFIINCVRKIKK